MTSEKFQRYQEEFVDDLNLDDMSLHDKQMRMPGVKHKWVGRLIQNKYEKEQLVKKRKGLIESVADAIQQQEPVVVSKPTLHKMAERHKEVIALDVAISELTLIIEFLEKMERVMAQTSFDIKNIIDIKKLELM